MKNADAKNQEVVYLTVEGLKTLQEEYDRLIHSERPAVAERIARAREFGDLSENAEYDAAKDQQSFVEGRIIELEKMLSHAQVIQNVGNDVHVVSLGSTVTVEIEGEKDTYTIVGSVEAQPEMGRISHESPVGKALLGLKVGDEVDVSLPQATLKYRVVKIQPMALN